MPLHVCATATARYRERHPLAARASVSYYAPEPLPCEVVLKGLAIYEAASAPIGVVVDKGTSVDNLLADYQNSRWYRAEKRLNDLGIEQMLIVMEG